MAASKNGPQPLTGKHVVLTGGTNGLGVGLLHETVRLGAAKVSLLCRSMDLGRRCKEEVRSLGPAEVVLVHVDLSSMVAVQKAAKEIEGGVDVLFLNAGLVSGAEATITPEGLETTFAVNVAAVHLLARLLVPKLSKGARIIVTGSDAGDLVKPTPWKVDPTPEAMQGLLPGVGGMGSYGFGQYSRTKVLAHQQAGALSDLLAVASADVHVCAWHPGALSSQLGNNAAPLLAACLKGVMGLVLRSPKGACMIGMHAATAAEPYDRAYLSDGNMGTPNVKVYGTPKELRGAEDAEVCRRSWSAVEALVCKALGVKSLPPVA
ncbi:hypothetical protein FOA52_000487 [Chlamydomonas sp. UWO 241]|nr:hypothetical protein FOA52_000487 [Chlamydomonas sp. UWO 241]